MSIPYCYISHRAGFKLDLYEHLFVKPSSLQEALAVPPMARRPKHVSAIASTLRLFPLVAPLTSEEIEELAMCIGRYWVVLVMPVVGVGY